MTYVVLTSCWWFLGAPLINGRSLPAEKIVSTVNLLAPQVLNETVPCGANCDKRECEMGCLAQAFCLQPPCYDGEKCPDEPVLCEDEWCFQDKAKDEPCPAERRAELCGDKDGVVCAERMGHQTNKVDTPMEYKAKHVKKGECVSIIEGTSDRWCQFTCTSGQDCPATNCVCGDLSGIDMTHDLASEAERNANDLQALMDAACDFDAQGCNSEVVPQCRACYLHFESCKNWPHFQEDGFTQKEMTLDDCMDEVAGDVAECASCNTPESKEAYKVRTGEHDPPGVSQPGKMMR